ncbi:HSP18 transcriptional regulator [Amycolatopsis pithecellobii]|uniref:HSP18 transcriptional regulator n=1 Tax=Amycolatopsis pithecellobii TaxID=664692 RepID=UPI0028B095E1|nr:HSP18 transcriptional regulator [Amycolatopsis pithecellobii]
MSGDPVDALEGICAAVAAGRAGTADREQLLAALSALRLLREEIATWEPALVTAARAAGVSWSALAPALGVASRQAAERRYLRLQPSGTGETTGEGRVQAERDRRAGDRAVAAWARRNSAALRGLAGQVSGLDGLDPVAQETADQIGAALGDDDVTTLLPRLAAARLHLADEHPRLAGQVEALTEQADRLRRDAADRRGRG